MERTHRNAAKNENQYTNIQPTKTFNLLLAVAGVTVSRVAGEAPAYH